MPENKSPAISVIVPVYNVERFVEQSIRSVLDQTFRDFELIVIDDASPDRSIEIVQRLAQSDARIKIIRHDHNRGPGAARNTGLERAHGTYIYFFDGDDRLAPNALELMHRAAKRNRADVVHCTSYLQRHESELGKFNETAEAIGDPRPIDGMMTDDRNARLVDLYANFGAWVMIWLNFYRRDFLEHNRLQFPNMLSEDEPFFVALLCLADKFYCIPEPLYVYSKRPDSISTSNSVERAARGITSMLEGCRYISDAMSRVPSITERTKSLCLQEFIERVTQSYILRRYDLNGLNDADAINNFTRALTPTFGDRSEIAARLLQGLALRSLQSIMIPKTEKQSPAISVIVPVYNVERFVEQAIQSVLGQTFSDFELIVVDDASPDRSIEIVQRLAQTDRRIKVVRHDHNQGLGAARNTGMIHARGKYIYFLDSDDLILPHALKVLHRTAEQYDAEVVHASSFFERWENESGSFDEPQRRSDKNPVDGLLTSDRNARLGGCFANYNFWSTVWLNLYRREFLERHALKFPSMLSEDEPFAVALYCLADRYVCVPECFYVYHRRRASLMGAVGAEKSRRAIASMVEGHRFIMSVTDQLSEDELSSAMRNACVQSFFSRMISNYILRSIESRDGSVLTPTRKPEVRIESERRKPRVFLMSVPTHGNLGDQAITEGELIVLHKIFPDREIVEIPTAQLIGSVDEQTEKLKPYSPIATDEVIFIHGGGNVGTLWPNEEQVHKDLIRRFPNNKIVILPQSIYFDPEARALTQQSVDVYNAHADLHLICRDEISLSIAEKLFPRVHRYLAPDIAIVLSDLLNDESPSREGALFILRRDKEKIEHSPLIASLQTFFRLIGLSFETIDTVVNETIRKDVRRQRVLQILRRVRRSRFVVTDRFHGTIFSAITRTPVLAMKSFDTKISSGTKWFSDLDYVCYADMTQPATIEKFVNQYVNAPIDANQFDGTKYEALLRRTLEKIITPPPYTCVSGSFVRRLHSRSRRGTRQSARLSLRSRRRVEEVLPA